MPLAHPQEPSSRALNPHVYALVTQGFAWLVLLLGWAEADTWGWWEHFGIQAHLWWHAIPLMLICPVAFLRIRRPELAVVLGVVCTALSLAIGVNIGIFACLSDLLYNLGIRGRLRTIRLAETLGAVASVATGILLFSFGADFRDAIGGLLLTAFLLLGPLWWSSEVRRGYPLWQESDAREQLEQERHGALLRKLQRRRAEALRAQRTSMAQELHDVVSADVSAIALTSGAALSTKQDSQRDREALQRIRDISVDALSQLGDLMQVLRLEPDSESTENDDADNHRPDIATRWDQVIATARERGLIVEVDGDAPSLPKPLDHVTNRVLQESLANALKHGDGHALVSTSVTRRTLRVRVESPLAQHDVAPQAPSRVDSLDPGGSAGTGVGLMGMTERVHAVGGRIRTGPEPSGIWVVSVELPLRVKP